MFKQFTDDEIIQFLDITVAVERGLNREIETRALRCPGLIADITTRSKDIYRGYVQVITPAMEDFDRTNFSSKRSRSRYQEATTLVIDLDELD